MARINTAFEAALSEIGCAGEVALDKSAGTEYDKYAIRVRAPTAHKQGYCMFVGPGRCSA